MTIAHSQAIRKGCRICSAADAERGHEADDERCARQMVGRRWVGSGHVGVGLAVAARIIAAGAACDAADFALPYPRFPSLDAVHEPCRTD